MTLGLLLDLPTPPAPLETPKGKLFQGDRGTDRPQRRAEVCSERCLLMWLFPYRSSALLGGDLGSWVRPQRLD